MAWHHSVGTAIRALLDTVVRRRRVESELDEEMRFHLDMEAERNAAAGMSPEIARRTAARDFGGVERHKEAVRDERGARWFEDLGQDVHYALRVLRRRLAFTVVAGLTLALGIGATTTLFGVVKAVLLTPLPYGRAESVAVVWSAWKGFDQTWLSYDEWEAYTTEIPAFDDIALFTDNSISLTDGDEPERIRAGFVTHNAFRTLAASPILGRTFTPEEDRPNGPRVVLLGHRLWQRRYEGDPSVVGRDIQIGGQATMVVGVMPEGFRLPLDYSAAGPTEAWLPLATDAASNSAAPGPAVSPEGMNHGYNAVARLAPGATVQQANAQLRSLVAQWVRDGPYPAEMQFRAFAVPVEEQVTGRIRQALLIVFGAVGLVLLIACTNVAGLLLVRGEQRRRELAVRVALGAGVRRLTRQLLTETLVLAGLGGALGVGLAGLGVWLVRQNAPAALARVAETRLDPVVLLFAVGMSLLAAVLSGVLPALQATNVAPASELKEGGRATTTGLGRLRWRQTLVAAEVALAVVLVVGAGLMVRSVSNLFAIDAGIRPEGVLTMRLTTPATWYPDSVRVTSFYDELRRRVSAIPGVEAVGAARLLPLATEMGDWGLEIEGYTPPPGEGTPGDWQVVTPGYFEAMGLRRIAGRFFDERDAMTAPLVMIVNQRFAEKYFAGRDPLGGRVRIGGSPDSAFATIVGVVANVRHNALTQEVKAQFYAPHGQFAVAPGNTSRSMSLVVRTSGEPNTLVTPVRAVIREMDPRLPVSEVRTMEDVVGQSIAEPRFAMGLLGLFGVLALVLSAIGIFGIVSQVVTARSHEFGIRAALGATPRDIVMLSLGTGVRQTLAGLAVGVVAALLLTRAMTGLLHGVAPTDPITFAIVIVVTAAVAIAASVIPARRAGKADPTVVLHEG